MLRAGPFSDERVVSLINRRFVPFTFDLMPGALHDAAAKAFLVQRRPEFGGRMISNEPLMVVTPDGEIVGETIRYADTNGVLRLLQRALAKRKLLARPAPAEAQGTPLERARVHIDLLELDRARELLADQKGDEAQYLLGRIARFEQEFKRMERHFARVEAAHLADDLRMERAYEAWHARRYADLAKQLADFPAESNRAAEAAYYRGVALYLLGTKDEALATWKKLVETHDAGPWVYRADWSYTTVKGGGPGGVVMSGGPRTSLLGRIAYMGEPNPDLDGPD